jgi:hypothetical protein
MTRKILASCLVALCSLVLALGAQSYEKKKPEGKHATMEKKTTSAVPDSKSVSLTGCLKAGKAANTFTLSNVTGETATYRLVGQGGVDLKPHVGHKVEVTGMRVPQGKGKGASDRLNVTAIKHIAASCP